MAISRTNVSSSPFNLGAATTATGRYSTTSFTDATCTADNYIRYQASAISGTPTAIEITITYTIDS